MWDVITHASPHFNGNLVSTVKPICNDHLYDKIYYLLLFSNVL